MKEKKIEVVPFRWAGVRTYHADPDEATDAVESKDYLLAADSIIAEETIAYEENADGERIRSTIGKNRPMSTDWEVALQPVLKPSEAKCYAYSAAPAFRGRMSLNILRVSGREVFA